MTIGRIRPATRLHRAGKISDACGPGHRPRSVNSEARVLAVWGVVFGALAVFPLFAFFRFLSSMCRALCRHGAHGHVSALLLHGRPIAERHSRIGRGAHRAGDPVHGLSAAAVRVAVGLAAVAFGAILSGFVIGMRSQTAWVTMPVLIAVAWMHATREPARRAQSLAMVALAFTVGAALWAVPLLISSGGLNSYLASLSVQGSLDFSDSDMLIRQPSVGRLIIGTG